STLGVSGGVEPLENRFLILRRNPGARIGHADPQPLALYFRVQSDRPAVRRVLDRVAEDVAESQLQQRGVTHHPARPLVQVEYQLQAALLRHPLVASYYRFNDRAQVRRADLE